MGSPTSTAVKICGITKTNQAKAIAEYGVDAIGVIGVQGSPRYVAEDQRRKLFNEISNCDFPPERVWVIADMNDKQIERGLNGYGSPSIVQLHGKESPQRCRELNNRYPKTKWWKAIRIHTPSDLALALSYEGHIDALLLDAWSPNELGGTGNRIPIQWLQDAKFPIPWWLAGGISAEWIPEILRSIEPFGIDASSRLEVSPGIKDLQQVHALVEAVKGKTR